MLPLNRALMVLIKATKTSQTKLLTNSSHHPNQIQSIRLKVCLVKLTWLNKYFSDLRNVVGI